MTAGAPYLVVVLDGIPPSPNRTVRQHFYANAAMRQTWHQATEIALDEAMTARWGGHRPKPLASAVVELVVMVKSRIRRDPDNAVAACKPIFDGLVTGGLLADDSFKVIRHLGCRIEPSHRNGIRVEVYS